MQFFKGMVEGGKNGGEVFGNGFAAAGEGNDAVSYTHLTLPTT